MAWSVLWANIKRIVRSVPKIYVVVFITASVSFFGIVHSGGDVRRLVPWFIAAILASFVFIVFQTCLEYMKDNYDPALALKYEERFDSMKSERSSAAKAIKEHKNCLADIDSYKKELEPIDEVLDLLDTLGFYLQGGQISHAVMHRHFYYWIRGYWRVSRPYIEAWRSKEGEGPRWEHIEKLFETTCAIEISRGKSTREKELAAKTDEFLDEEISLCDNGPGAEA